MQENGIASLAPLYYYASIVMNMNTSPLVYI